MNFLPSSSPSSPVPKCLAALTLTFTLALSFAAPAWCAEYNLKKTALKAGQTVNNDGTMAMADAALTISLPGQTLKGTMSMTTHKVQVNRITAVKDGQPTEVEIEVKEATQKQAMTMNGQPRNTEKKEPLHGTTVISRKVNGVWQNQLKSGEPTPEQAKALQKLKAFDEDDMFEDRPLAPGASWAVAPATIAKMFSDSATTNTTGSMQCKFERVENYEGQLCAVIAVVMKVSGSPPDQPGATLAMELKGNIYRSLEEKVDLKRDLAGTMKMEGPVPGAPPGARMESNGPMTMTQTATVSK